MPNSLPKFPKVWANHSYVGWVKHDALGNVEKVDTPSCDTLVFDTENCVKIGHVPILAVAASGLFSELIYSKPVNSNHIRFLR